MVNCYRYGEGRHKCRKCPKKREEKIRRVEEKRWHAERVQKEIVHWNKQNNDVPAPNCILKV